MTLVAINNISCGKRDVNETDCSTVSVGEMLEISHTYDAAIPFGVDLVGR